MGLINKYTLQLPSQPHLHSYFSVGLTWFNDSIWPESDPLEKTTRVSAHDLGHDGFTAELNDLELALKGFFVQITTSELDRTFENLRLDFIRDLVLAVHYPIESY